MDKYSSTTYVYTVSTIPERDILIRRIYANLTAPPQLFLVQQDQVNRIKVFHDADPGIRALFRTYLVIVIPIIVDLKPLDSICGNVDFKLDETISRLQKTLSKLQALQGRRFVKGNSDASFRQLVESLC